MRIGLIAPPWVPIPPVAYGGTEEVVDELARGLASCGHDVELFASGDSTCPVPHRAVFAHPPPGMNESLPECRHVQAAYEQLTGCDLIHDHTTLGPVWARAIGYPGPLLVTVHNPFTTTSRPVYREIARSAALVAISRDHRASAPDLPIQAVVHHGLDPNRYVPGTGAGGYALYLGRFGRDKGADEAIQIAQLAGIRLVLAAKMRTPDEHEFFQARIRPRLGPDVEYAGEVHRDERDRLMREAMALLNPIRWREPFGLVMIESLAHGTPVIAYPRGSAPEIVVDGVTGFLPHGVSEAARCLLAAPDLDRRACRAAVEGHFSARRMVADYLRVYSALLPRAAVRAAG